uniref:Uncharacterized protein n=1 Tax=Physcomitrium patens TaxID=3218 RepID=A0A2K1IDD9_PHYPA|nr:hypothetical protein PHYPA_029445 [Physcomitrium patens]
MRGSFSSIKQPKHTKKPCRGLNNYLSTILMQWLKTPRTEKYCKGKKKVLKQKVVRRKLIRRVGVKKTNSCGKSFFYSKRFN